MTFDEWKRLVNQAGAAFDFVEPKWIEDQFRSGRSPVEAARMIKSGQAPRYAPVAMLPPHQQPFVIHPNNPKAMRIPRDEGEWKILAVLASIVLYGALYVFSRANAARETARDFSIWKVQEAEISTKMIQIQFASVLVAVAAVIAMRALFLYSPYVSWSLPRTFGVGGCVTIFILLTAR